jgi:hypothetical protein
MGMRKAKFSLEGFDGVFEGYTFGQRWNGWQVPYFTKEVGLKIMEAMAEDEGNHPKYDEERDMFVVSNDYDDATEEFPAMEFAGDGEIHKLYPIGSGSWVWDEEVEEKPSNPVDVQLDRLREFRSQMTQSLHELLDALDENDYDHKFDLHIEWNGHKLELPMHADIYSRFEAFIEETIEEELE